MTKRVNPAWRQPNLQQQGGRPTVDLASTIVDPKDDAQEDDETQPEASAVLEELVASRYRVEQELGHGAMGVVYRAEDLASGGLVALKILKAEAPPVQIDRFLVEAKIGLTIVDEHVCRLFDVGVDPQLGRPFMAMELLQGRDLEAQLDQRGGSLPLDEACHYILSACAGLAAAHAIGVVHRDVKHSNLFLSVVGHGPPVLKVLDFGVSKAPGFDHQTTRMTKTGDLVGTPLFMAPEQLRSAKSVDARADVWSLGVILYEALSGTSPFDANSMAELFSAILTRPHVPLAARRPDLPAAIGDIIDVTLHKDRERRFASVVALARALAPFTPRGAELFERVRARVPRA